MTIRKASYDDVKTLNHFLTLLLRDEKQYDPGINENHTVTNMYEHYIEDCEKLLIVAEEDNQIVGYLYGIIEPSNVAFNYTVAKLDALYVLENYRKHHIATSLIEYFKKWGISKKANRLEVNVWSQNTKAKNLYLNEEFQPASETLMINLP